MAKHSLGCLLLQALAILSWGHAGLALEILTEKGRIGEVEVFGDLVDSLVGVHQVHLNADDECLIYPSLGGHAARLSDDSAEVTFGEAQALCIITNLMLLGTMLVDKLNEAVEYGLVAGAVERLPVGVTMIKRIVMMHDGGDKRRGCRTVIIGLMHQMPQRIKEMADSLDFGFGNRQLKVSHLPIEGRGHLSRRERHGKIGEKSKSI